MSDTINGMNVKQLRNEVQLLRDELAIMKRKYEDIIYNLDTDNFSSRFVKEQGNMKTAIEVNAKGITTKVSSEEFESAKTQTAQKIESEVKKLSDKDTELSSKITQTASEIRSEVKKETETIVGKFDKYSTIEQTEQKISASVKQTIEYAEEYVTDTLANGGYVTDTTFETNFNMYANGIYANVEAIYETKDNASNQYSGLRSSISSVSQTANSISTKVGDIENGEFKNYTLFTQSADKFYLDGDQTIFTGCIWLTNNAKQKRFSISHDESNPATPFIQLYNQQDPLVLGRNQTSVYVGDANNDNSLVATRGWVLDNAGGGGGTATAVFG